MPLTRTRNLRVSRRLIGGVVLVSLLATIATTVMQTWRDYQTSLTEVETSLRQLRDSSLPNLVNAVWIADSEQIEAQLVSLIKQENIVRAQLWKNGEVYLHAGPDNVKHVVNVEFPIEYRYRNNTIDLGQLRVSASLEDTYAKLIEKATAILVSNGIMAFLLAGFILVYFHYLVSRHLYVLLDKVQQFRLSSNSNESTPGIIKVDDNLDEITQLASAFELMQIEATRSYEHLLSEKEKSQVTLASIGDGVIVTDSFGLIESINPVAASLTEWSEEKAIGKPVGEIFQIIDEVTRQLDPNPVNLALNRGVVPRHDQHKILVSSTGTETAIEESVAPIIAKDGNIIGAILVFHDVTYSRNLSRELSWQANHDSLTGLTNRRAFEQQLDEAVVVAGMRNQQHVLLFLDLDQFKIVNDTCGHQAGDELLKQISALLQNRLRRSDVLARLGGDEFGVLLLDCDSNKGKEIAEGLRSLVHEYRFGWENKTFRVGASIGMVEISEKGSIKDLMRFADLACYQAKDRGRNRIHVYQNEEGEVRESELLWINRITEAFENNRFELYAQPIVHGDTLEVHHHEVLLRMHLVDGTPAPPAMFIPPAERYGIMPSIDRWVVRKSFQWMQEHAEFQPKLAINLSGASLGDSLFPEFVTQIFDEYNVSGSQVCFEITETTAIANLSQALALINLLKTFDCSFALDDFGSGLSSFGYLKSLPVDYLKIDGSFVRDMVVDPVDHAMVQAIHQVGLVMGIESIAEYVEDESVIESCRKLGISYLQGYGVGKPAPLQNIYIENQPARAIAGK